MIQVGLQEGVIVFDRHTAIRIAIRAEQESVREETGPAEDFSLILGDQPQRADPMEKLFPQFEIVDIRRSGAVHSFIDVAGVIEQATKSRMRFELGAVRHVDDTC